MSANWNHCGDTKPHAEHRWVDEGQLPVLEWTAKEIISTTIEIPETAYFMCAGTRPPRRIGRF